MIPRPKTQRTQVRNREPPTSEDLAKIGLRRIAIYRHGDEDAGEAIRRVTATLPWASGITGELHGGPYQCGTRWVFVYRPTEAPPNAAMTA